MHGELGMLRADRRPAGIIKVEIEARQHDPTLLSRQRRLHQNSGCWNRACRSSDDDGPGAGPRFKFSGPASESGRADGRLADKPARMECRRKRLPHMVEKTDGRIVVVGGIAVEEARKPLRIETLDLKLANKLGDAAGQGDGLPRRGGDFRRNPVLGICPSPGIEDIKEEEFDGQRRRNREAGQRFLLDAILRIGEIAKGHYPGQQHAGSGPRHEQFRKPSGSPAGRKIDGGEGQGDRTRRASLFLKSPRQNKLRERWKEFGVGRYREYLGRGFLPQERLVRRRSASSIASGVPTCNQAPAWQSPWSRPTAMALSHRRFMENLEEGKPVKMWGLTIKAPI